MLVEKVMEAVMILRGSEPTWAEAKRQLGESNFIKQLMNFDKDNISERVLKIGSYCSQSDFQLDIIGCPVLLSHCVFGSGPWRCMDVCTEWWSPRNRD